jgi:hypothetical protein
MRVLSAANGTVSAVVTSALDLGVAASTLKPDIPGPWRKGLDLATWITEGIDARRVETFWARRAKARPALPDAPVSFENLYKHSRPQHSLKQYDCKSLRFHATIEEGIGVDRHDTATLPAVRNGATLKMENRYLGGIGA